MTERERAQERIAMATDRAVKFFYDNAGYSYDPKSETPEEGRQTCAERLAGAELWAVLEGYTFHTVPDYDRAQDDRADGVETPEEGYWAMLMRDEEGALVQSLSGCEGGADYERVVKAELALQQMDEAK